MSFSWNIDKGYKTIWIYSNINHYNFLHNNTKDLSSPPAYSYWDIEGWWSHSVLTSPFCFVSKGTCNSCMQCLLNQSCIQWTVRSGSGEGSVWKNLPHLYYLWLAADGSHQGRWEMAALGQTNSKITATCPSQLFPMQLFHYFFICRGRCRLGTWGTLYIGYNLKSRIIRGKCSEDRRVIKEWCYWEKKLGKPRSSKPANIKLYTKSKPRERERGKDT